MISLIKKFFLAAALVATASGNAEKNGYKAQEKGNRLSVNAQATLPVRIDAGWYSFAYGRPGTLAYRTFGINNGQVVQLEVIGCFCPGNFFSVFDNGQPIIVTRADEPVKIANTPYDAVDCDPNTTNPNECALDRQHFGYGIALLLPGSHNISIVVSETPYLGGTAFLRVDTICTTPEDVFSPKPCCLITDTCSTSIVA